MTDVHEVEADQSTLHACLQRAVTERTHETLRIVDIERQTNGLSSSYATHFLTVHLSNGRTMSFFLKDFTTQLIPKSRLNDRWTRERQVYTDILADADLGTAHCYGAIDSPTGNGGWLLLEHVEATRLGAIDRKFWCAAADWLAGFHIYIRSHPQRLAAVAESLERHDASFYWHEVDKARRRVKRIGGELNERLQRILSQYEHCIDIMLNQERTLVHSGFNDKDILFDAATMRVCVVDWERAALGSLFYDLAHLSDALTGSELDSFLDTYRHRVETHGISLPNRTDMLRVLSAFYLNRTMRRIHKCWKELDPAIQVARLLDRAEYFASHL